MVYTLIYWLIQRLRGKRGPVAIKVEGELKGAKIENNVTIGMSLLEAKQITDSSIKGNISHLPAPKNVNLIWKTLPDLVIGLTVAFLAYKFGWK